MVKTIWAVACAGLISGLAALAGIGCGGAAISRPALIPNAPGSSLSLVSAQPGSPIPNSVGPHYRVGPEDVLRVSVWDNKELSLDVMVRPDGKISLPLIQDIQAEGLTAEELAAFIRGKLAAYVVEPHVSVIVLQVNAPKIFVIGEVAKPGPYPLRGEMSVLQALSLAGGFKEFASLKKITIVRANGGRQEIRKVNFYEMIQDDGRGNYLLMPGDTIVVP